MDNEKEIIPYLRLVLNIQYPPLDECWMEGYESGDADIAEKANPYPDSSTENEYWLEGWWEGFYKSSALSTVTDVKRNARKAKIKPTTIAQQKRPGSGKMCQRSLPYWGKIMRFVKISGVIAATFLISYQLIDVIR